ncbi:MAG: 4Fe-4S binding protein [Massilibacteroides sp.]|nr:4Fe-4S binding protein [Massilibacteroides sp.]MDD3063353.1 4Fe-4S binding protein [Massilibacteroides sp.]MDD4114214.1 4Fe-4S binding protein [Massilibacteroides sp.]MDD4661177.1 4Fe-4S binding protein [Massilibacteroides sp.]
MKRVPLLKWSRVFFAILFFLPVTLFFIDFRDMFPDRVSALLEYQLVPALLGGFAGILLFQFVLALLFGRIYCSVLCPAGILQDVINRLYCIGKKKKKGTRRFSYHSPMNVLRYGLLGVTILFALFGFTGLLMLLDPYSNFGRIATNLFRPVTMWINNLAADFLMRVDNYSLYHVTVTTVTTAALIAALVALILFIVLVAWRGRLFCNTLCPVGSLLGLISRYSLFRVSFDKNNCIQCGLCAQSCKAEAIDAKQMTVDTSRCVDCFNCIGSCSKNSLTYRFNPVWKRDRVVLPVELSVDSSATPHPNGRRSFLATTVAIAGSVSSVSTLANKIVPIEDPKIEKWPPVTPPGSLSLERFKDKCTACHLCVVQCPSHVLRPAGLEYGFDFLLRPHLAYIDSYCNYECTVCSDVCPTGAIRPLTKEEKITTQVGVAKFMIERCIVHTEKTDCGACSEHCPTQAVHMVPYEGTLTIPAVTEELCIGCGGCESICPVRPVRAIIVKSNIEHIFVEPPKEEKVKEVQIDDFGF